MGKERSVCFICKKEIDVNDDNSFVIMKIRDSIRVHCHSRHHGVMDEYDSQLGVKKRKE